MHCALLTVQSVVMVYFKKIFKDIFSEELRLKKEKVSSVKDSFLDTGLSQSAFTCSKLTIETLQQDVKYVQN